MIEEHLTLEWKVAAETFAVTLDSPTEKANEKLSTIKHPLLYHNFPIISSVVLLKSI
jgi:hypothetical protein